MTRVRIVELGADVASLDERRSPPLVVLHGFTQTHESWLPLATAWAMQHHVLLVDLPGHGGSSTLSADLPDAAQMVAAAVAERTDLSPVWIGYSLGGRVALHVAVLFTSAISGLVTIGATGGLDDPADRTERRAADAHLVAQLREIGVERFVERWLSGPLFAGLSPTSADLAARRANTVEGLADSLLRCGTGTQQPLWDRLAACNVPALFLAGERDAKFLALAHRLALSVGGLARATAVPGAGHAAHLEQPATVDAEVRRFLAEFSR